MHIGDKLCNSFIPPPCILHSPYERMVKLIIAMCSCFGLCLAFQIITLIVCLDRIYYGFILGLLFSGRGTGEKNALEGKSGKMPGGRKQISSSCTTTPYVSSMDEFTTSGSESCRFRHNNAANGNTPRKPRRRSVSVPCFSFHLNSRKLRSINKWLNLMIMWLKLSHLLSEGKPQWKPFYY